MNELIPGWARIFTGHQLVQGDKPRVRTEKMSFGTYAGKFTCIIHVNPDQTGERAYFIERAEGFDNRSQARRYGLRMIDKLLSRIGRPICQ